MVYTPTETQLAVKKALRTGTGIGNLVTDQQIYDAVSDVVANPRHMFADDIILWTRIKLVNDFIKSAKFLKGCEISEGVAE